MKSILKICSLFFMISATGQLKVGDSLMAAGDFSSAIEAYGNASSGASKLFKTARAYNAMGDINASRLNYQQGLEIDSLDVTARYEYGKVLYRNMMPVESFTIFRDLLETHPDVAAYHYHLGKSLQIIDGHPVYGDAVREYEVDADSAFAKALQLQPRYRNARTELVKSLIRQRSYVKAISLAQVGLKFDPNDVKFLSLAAQAMMASKQFEEAITVFEKLFTLNADTAYNRKNLAAAYFYDGQMEPALENNLLYVSDHNNEDDAAYFMLSKIYTRFKKLDLAQENIELALYYKTALLDQEYLQLATIYRRKGDLQESFQTLKKASTQKPDNDIIAYQVVVGADRYFKDKKVKLQYYERFVEKFPDSDYISLASERISDLKQAIFMAAGK